LHINKKIEKGGFNLKLEQKASLNMDYSEIIERHFKSSAHHIRKTCVCLPQQSVIVFIKPMLFKKWSTDNI
jgi:hypothetical protein